MADSCVCGREVGPQDRFCASCGRLLGPGPAAPVARRGPADAATPDAVTADALVELLRGFVGQQVADRITLEGGRPTEERRLVTALFADLSGFAALAGRLDAEDLQGLVDPVLSGLARIVSRYDGYVEKFAGDALLALFGAPVAHEDDAARALHAALDMQAELAGLVDAQVAEPFRLHIGVTTGTVVARTIGSTARMDYAVLGEAVVLAQRLQAAAPAGEVYVGAPTRELVGAEFAFEDLGSLLVKGRPAPVPASRLLGLGGERRWDDGPLVGRAREQVLLAECLGRAQAGDRVVVRLTGSPGSGKSRLLAQVRRAAEAEGVPVVELLGAAHAQSPYSCLLPLVTAALQRRYPGPGDVLDRLAADASAPAAWSLTAVLAGRAGSGDALDPLPPDLVRRQLAGAVRDWLVDLAARDPLVLLADGLHRFDAASREVVEQLAADPVPGVLLCLGTRTGADVSVAGEVRLDLGVLDAAAVRELVVAELGLVPDERLLAYVADRGQGNPLMVRETVRQLRSEELLDEQHGFARLVSGGGAQSVPATLEGLLAARLDALPHPAAQVATVAAAFGLVVVPELLERASGL
ncbi:MAG: adenylate/guanylate cyclase domain-containing protein, partial [Janthinobacterium lividum]